MAVNWTKQFSASDDGAVLTGAQVRTIQDDIDASLTTMNSWVSATATFVTTSTYTVTTADIGKVMLFNAGTVAVTATLFDITGNQILVLKNIGSAAVTLTANSTDTCEVATLAAGTGAILVSASSTNRWYQVGSG
jgi:hypothetical protein